MTVGIAERGGSRGQGLGQTTLGTYTRVEVISLNLPLLVFRLRVIVVHSAAVVETTHEQSQQHFLPDPGGLITTELLDREDTAETELNCSAHAGKCPLLDRPLPSAANCIRTVCGQ